MDPEMCPMRPLAEFDDAICGNPIQEVDNTLPQRMLVQKAAKLAERVFLFKVPPRLAEGKSEKRRRLDLNKAVAQLVVATAEVVCVGLETVGPPFQHADPKGLVCMHVKGKQKPLPPPRPKSKLIRDEHHGQKQELGEKPRHDCSRSGRCMSRVGREPENPDVRATTSEL
ncbi:hypothetical protein HPB48_004252 [Haemaphysalis longicornis]|uniref:Uncharacterized protein n=1 Tax=Haemaphysalis longicornis TaxID=44386 RepID=A0A9J6G8T8_HAELO|nr:hypothetical protein HPB48_004252 [Haemaphysalis longicornis]